MANEKTKVFQKGEIIFRQGDAEFWMYDILSGGVAIYAEHGTEDEKLLVELGAGRHFGELGLIECYPRSATAVATEDNTALQQIEGADVNVYFADKPEEFLAIMRTISARTRSLTKEYMEVCRAISEAANAAKKGVQKSSGLKAKLSKFVKDYIKPHFLGDSADYDMDIYMVDSVRSNEALRRYGANDVIFREGDSAGCMYDIVWGRVGIYADYGKPTQKLLNELNEEKCFGEMGIIDNEPRSATAVSLEKDTQLKMITVADFSEYLKNKPAKVLIMMQQMSARLRALTKKYLEACKSIKEATEAENEKDDCSVWTAEHINAHAEEFYYFNTYL